MGDLVRLDLRRQLRHLYVPSTEEVAEVYVPEMQFAMVDGEIEKGVSPRDSPYFASCIGALFALSYTLKFVSKRRPVDPIDYKIMALEGLWTTPAGGVDYAVSDEWSYTLMIMQPDHITEEMFAEAREKLRAKRTEEGHITGALEGTRLERFAEGRCVQVMHLGPYLDEPRTLEKMTAYVQARRYEFHGPHHEIYLSDPRTAEPGHLKTVLRHAVRPAG